MRRNNTEIKIGTYRNKKDRKRENEEGEGEGLGERDKKAVKNNFICRISYVK